LRRRSTKRVSFPDYGTHATAHKRKSMTPRATAIELTEASSAASTKPVLIGFREAITVGFAITNVADHLTASSSAIKYWHQSAGGCAHRYSPAHDIRILSTPSD